MRSLFPLVFDSLCVQSRPLEQDRWHDILNGLYDLFLRRSRVANQKPHLQFIIVWLCLTLHLMYQAVDFSRASSVLVLVFFLV